MSISWPLVVALLHVIPVEVDPLDGRNQLDVRVVCDPVRCSVSWTTFSTVKHIKMRWFDADGGLGALSTLEGTVPFSIVQCVGGVNGARWHVYDTSGTVSYDLWFSSTDGGAGLDTSAVKSLDPSAEVGNSCGFAYGAATNLVAFVSKPASVMTVRVRRVDDNGAFVDPSSLLAQASNQAVNPTVAWLGGIFWIVFTNRFDTNQYDPFLTLWREDNTPVVEHLALPRSAVDDEDDATIVAAGDHLLTAWSRWSTPPSLVVYRIEPDAGVGAPLLAVPNAHHPRLAHRSGRNALAFISRLPDAGEQVELGLLAEVDGGATLQRLFQTETGFDSAEAFPAFADDQTLALGYIRRGLGGASRVWLAFIDAGAFADAGSDAGAPGDGGAFVDAGSDAGGLGDGGAFVDAGSDAGGLGDGGTLPDGGQRPEPQFAVTCGCSSAGTLGLFALLALVGRVLWRRR